MAAKDKANSPEQDPSRAARGSNAKAKAAAADKETGVVMTVDAKALHDALGRVQATVEKRNTIPILSMVLVEADKGGAVRLYTTDLDMQAEAGIGGDEAKVYKGGAFCVEAALFYQLAGRMKGEIVIEHHEPTRRLKLGAGRSSAELGTLPAHDFQTLAAIDDEVELAVPAKALAAGLNACWHSISTEATRYYLNGIYLEPDGNRLLFTSTDGHRLTQLPVTVDGEAVPDFEGVIVPRKAVAQFIKIAEAATGPVKLSISDRMIEVAHERTGLRSKLIDGQYPDYRRVIPKEPFTEIVFPVKEMREALDLVIAASTEKSKSVKFELDEGRITLSVRNAEGQRAEAIVEHTDMPPFKEPLGLNGGYMQTAVAKLATEEGVLRLRDAGSPARVESEGDDLIQVIMPLRV